MSEYKLVPVEPTEEMISSAFDFLVDGGAENIDGDDVRGAIRFAVIASPTTDTITIDRTEYEAMKADAERWKYCVERKKFPIYINHRLEESEDWHIDMGSHLIIEDTPEMVVDQARKI